MKNLEYNIFIILPILSILVFISLVSIAMLTYNGGNAIDHDSHGYSFATNYLSDLGKKIAMHIAATNPISINIGDIPSDILDREKNIFSVIDRY